jgi:hypothetical protein
MRHLHARLRFKRLKQISARRPKHPQHTLSWYVTPVYGAKTQYATKDETPPLTSQQCLTIQKVTIFVLYYARAVDPTVLMPLNDTSTGQTKATEKTQAATNQLLDYLATHPDATIRYHASDMIVHSTATPHTLQFQTHEAASEVCFSWGINPPRRTH